MVGIIEVQSCKLPCLRKSMKGGMNIWQWTGLDLDMLIHLFEVYITMLFK
jgi:hypothetical protein